MGSLPPELARAHAAIERRRRARYLLDITSTGGVIVTIRDSYTTGIVTETSATVSPAELVTIGLQALAKSYGRRFAMTLLRGLGYNR